MTEYLRLGEKRLLFADIFRLALQEAADNRDIDNSSALTVQRVFRGTQSRERQSKRHYAASEIQRVVRGIFGRERSNVQHISKMENRQLSLYFYLCIQIQKSFRGYYSRRYKHDQARRKRDCKDLEARNEQAREAVRKHAIELANSEAEEANNRKEREFRELAQNLHHLTSTKQIRGVYNPALEYVDAPLMNAVRVEDHIRGVVRDLLRTRGISKTGLVTDIHGTKKVPLKGLKNRLSIQASAPYDAVEQEKKREKVLHNILIRNKGNFTSGGTTNLINKNPEPAEVPDPFMDSWANPMLVKGVPKDQKQLMESSRTRKALFATHIEKPFVSRVGGNKSTTLANDIFDVIAEAEETGGAAQRQLGTGTSRFGLSANVDNRLGDSTIPMPPIRASCSVKSTRPKIKTFNIGVKAATASASLRQQVQNMTTALDDLSFISEEAPPPGESSKSKASRRVPSEQLLTDVYASSSDEEDNYE